MILRLLIPALLAAPALAQPAADAVRASCIDRDRVHGREGESDHSILFHVPRPAKGPLNMGAVPLRVRIFVIFETI